MEPLGKRRVPQILWKRLLKGFRGIDTACQPKHYKEPLVGEGIARAMKTGIKRSELFIQTKFTPFRGARPQ